MISGGLSDSATSASQEGARRPVTQAQRPFIAAHLRHPDVAINNMALLVRFADGVEVEALSAAFDRVVADHDVLRTQIDDRLVLEGWVTISPVPPAASSVVAVSIDHCFRWAQHRAEQQLDLAHCCYDSVILDHGDAGASWYLNLHHVITDATGSANVLELTASHYATLVTGISSDRRAASMSPPEPTTAAPRLPEGDKRGAEPSQANPLAAPRRIDGAELYRRAPTPTTEIIATEVALDAGRGQACRDAIALGTYRLLTPNLGWTALLASATAILIHRLTRRPTVRLILPVHRRDRTNVNEPGLAMQMMLLEVEPHADDTHQSLHARVTRTLFDKLRSDHTDWVVGDADAMVNVVPDRAPTRFGGHAVETHWIYSHHEAPELALRLHLTGYGLNEGAAEPLRIQLDVNRGGADDEQLRRCPDHLGSILDAMIAAPDAPIGTAELCLGDERARLVPWESTPTSEQEPFASVVDQLRAALSDRDDIAVESAATRESWTGRDYWRWVEAFAQRLVADGGGPGTRIAIELPMSVEALVAIHAALVVGASFVPIDPEAPDLRRADLTQRSAPAFVVSDRSEVRAARSSDAAGTRGLATSGLAIRDPAPADEAYVMFTSGSTGTPKGVPISHGGLAWHLGWAIEHHLRGRGPIVAPLFGALGFDLTITSLFAPLLADGRLVVFEGAGRTAILDIAARTDLSWCKATPSHMELFAREASADHKLSTLVTNGEAFPPELVQRLHTLLPALEMINEYGPTEAVVGCAFRRIVPESDATSTSVSFGPPAPGTTFRVVDAFDR